MILHSVTPDRAYLVDDDPVRPNISYAFRISNNKDFFVFTGSTVGVVPILRKGTYTGKINKLGIVKVKIN